MQGIELRVSFVETTFIALAELVANVALTCFFALGVIFTLGNSSAYAATKHHLTKVSIAIAGLTIAPMGVVLPRITLMPSAAALVFLGSCWVIPAAADFDNQYPVAYEDVWANVPLIGLQIRPLIDRHLSPDRIHNTTELMAGFRALGNHMHRAGFLIQHMRHENGNEPINPQILLAEIMQI